MSLLIHINYNDNSFLTYYCLKAAAVSTKIPNNVIFELYEAGRGVPTEDKLPKITGYERSGPKLGGSFDTLFEGLKSGPVII